MKQIPLVLEECLPCTCGILLCIITCEEYMQVDAFWLLSSNRFGVQLLDAPITFTIIITK